MSRCLLVLGIVALTVALFTSCEKYNEVPPTQITKGKEYKLPDPTTLSQEDRAVISAQEQEYNENAK